MGAMNTVTAGRFRLLIGAAAAAAVMTGCGPGSSPGSSAASSPASPNTATASSAASAVAAAASSAAAVATSAAPAAASGSGDVCSMLSAAQASAINKVTYGPGVPKAVQSDWDECTYPNKGSADPVDIQALTVDVVRISGCWDQFKQIDGPGTAVAGVGDAAFGYEIGLDVESGSTCVTIKGLTHAEFSGDHSRDIAIAKIVLASLH
jgi:hypothetical protein